MSENLRSIPVRLDSEYISHPTLVLFYLKVSDLIIISFNLYISDKLFLHSS